MVANKASDMLSGIPATEVVDNPARRHVAAD
jgi:hypothetical protein